MNKSLSQLAVVHYGKSPNSVRQLDGAYPVYGSSGLVAQANEKLFDGKGIVVARKGTLGNPTYVEGGVWVIDTAFYVDPLSGVNAKWLYYQLQNFDLTRLNEATGVPSIGRDQLYRVEFFTPHEPIQERIAEILSSLDEQIAVTELLLEKNIGIKQGMMADLFSRGIDPATGQLRPRATDAPSLYYLTPLGLLPTTWEAVPLKVVCDLQVGFAFKSELFVEEGVSLLRGENVGFGYPIWKERRCLPKHVAEQYSEYKLAVGDLVIGMDRTFTKSGVKISRLGLADVPSLLVQRVGRFIPFGMVDGLIDHVLKQEQYLRALTIAEQGMDIPHLSKEDILSPLVAVPKCPLEAEMIVKRLKTIQLYIEHEETQKQKLISQKIGLMRDLLTGKVPVSA
ncbi:restriction endonuclease subunit S [Aeromonas hydrophila]